MGDEDYSNKIDYRGALNHFEYHLNNLAFLISEQKELLEDPTATEEDKKESRKFLRELNEDFFNNIRNEIYFAKKVRTRH